MPGFFYCHHHMAPHLARCITFHMIQKPAEDFLHEETPFPSNARDELIGSYRSSNHIAGLRVRDMRAEIDGLRELLTLRERSLSWRVTAPLRFVRALSLGRLPSGRSLREVPGRFRQIWREGHLWERLVRRDEPGKLRLAQQRINMAAQAYRQPVIRSPDLLVGHVVIIAELSLKQCAKYRVWQKREALETLGWQVTVVDWRASRAAWTALQGATDVVFYRTPGFDSVMALVSEAHRLALDPVWEVDDLIFDAAEYRQNGNIDSLPQVERDLLLSGVGLFRQCMLACGRGIASTDALAEAMREAGLEDVRVVENALDAQTLAFATTAREQRSDRDERVWVCYGSGTNTHDADFRIASRGLARAMRREPSLCLRIFGDVSLPEELQGFGDRVERRQGLDYALYLQELANTDIAIAPLEETRFNDAKSNIKYIEASILELPSICSPRAAFRVVVRSGENGLTAETEVQWEDAFIRLTGDAALRRRLGQRAYADVLARYAPQAVAREQVAPAFGPVPSLDRSVPRVLLVNIYFAPLSFGGATIVVEEMARRLAAYEMKLAIFTGQDVIAAHDQSASRYQTEGLDVLAVRASENEDALGAIENPEAAAVFAEWIDVFRPDLVHIHALQGLGVGLLRACEERGVPYVLTLHDAWWLCDRQFMVREDGRYCFQKKIDLRICQECVKGAAHLESRAAVMRHGLRNAALLLSPSETHRALYVANGVDPEKIALHRNGFRWPTRPRKARVPGAPLRFGFVGGTENIKGYGVLKRAAAMLEENAWSLTLVDNKINLGFHSIDRVDWGIRGELRVVAAYTQDTMDAFYDEIDVLLFPSQWKESFGLTVREALARDVWVVSTSPGGQAEPITDGVNGTLIPLNGHPQALADAMGTLIGRVGEFDTYTNPLKDQLSDYDTQARELSAFYDRVLREAAAKRARLDHRSSAATA